MEHRATDKMWSDVLTKPKQGAAFRKDRAMLIDCAVEYCDEAERNDIPQVLLRSHRSFLKAHCLGQIAGVC